MLHYLALFVLLLCASCGKTVQQKENKIRFALNADPTTLDPRKARDLESQILVRMLFEGLTSVGENGKAKHALIESFSLSDDGLEYTFHLRKALWSNGEPITSFDFAQTWKTILTPHFATDIAYQLYPIKNSCKAKQGVVALDAIGIATPDAQTLCVTLEHPTPYFLELLSMPAYYPVYIKNNEDFENAGAHIVSNGPFILQEWKRSDSVVLAKNALYWDSPSIQLDSADFLIASPDTALRMYEKGDLDWAGSPLSTIPSDAVTTLKNEKELFASPFAATYFYRINTSPTIKGKENILSQLSFRKALALSLDRAAIAQHILQGGQQPAFGLVPPEMDLRTEGYFRENLEEALAALAQAPLCNEPITISYANTERNAVVAQAVQKQWEKALGVSVCLEAIEPKIFFQRISKKEYQIAAGSWTADFNDPINFLEVFKYKDASTNNTSWENATFTHLLEKSSQYQEESKRKECLIAAEALLMQEMPIIPLFHFALNYVKKDTIADISLSPLGHLDLRNAHVINNLSSTLCQKQKEQSACASPAH